ncbi:hypothetical protein PMAYCL1PPCAC_29009, partial [Pristionchus mayeri]
FQPGSGSLRGSMHWRRSPSELMRAVMGRISERLGLSPSIHPNPATRGGLSGEINNLPYILVDLRDKKKNWKGGGVKPGILPPHYDEDDFVPVEFFPEKRNGFRMRLLRPHGRDAKKTKENGDDSKVPRHQSHLNENWFFSVTGEEASSILMRLGLVHGSFVVRTSKSTSNLSLTVVFDENIAHFHIMKVVDLKKGRPFYYFNGGTPHRSVLGVLKELCSHRCGPLPIPLGLAAATREIL